MTSQLRSVGLCLAAAALGLILPPNAARAQRITSISFVGQQNFPTGTTFQGTQFGGLSGIVHSGIGNQYYAISDDRSQNNPARFYTVNVDLADGALNNGDVTIAAVTTLLQPNGQAFPALSLDPEGIALAANGNVFISSEGDRNNNFQPFVNEFNVTTGQQSNALSVPSKFQITPTEGVRNNLGFESLNRNGNSLFTASEAALLQDGAPSTLTTGSPVRLLTYDLTTNLPGAEFVYLVDPIPVTPNPANAFADNGLVEIIALGGNDFLAMERNFSTGVGNSIRLYQFSLGGATNVSGINSLTTFGLNNVVPVQKTLLANLADFGLTPDNVEGIALGPLLPNGQRSLILVSDNNFSATQTTQFMAFSITQTTAPEPGSAALAITGLLSLAGIVPCRRK